MAVQGENNLNSLLKAEEEANRIIKRAEDMRDSMRQAALDQTKNEINQLRSQMEKEYQAKKAASSKSDDTLINSSNQQIAKHDKEFNDNKEGVIKMLAERVMYVKYEVPRNVKADFDSINLDKQVKQ